MCSNSQEQTCTMTGRKLGEGIKAFFNLKSLIFSCLTVVSVSMVYYYARDAVTELDRHGSESNVTRWLAINTTVTIAIHLFASVAIISSYHRAYRGSRAANQLKPAEYISSLYYAYRYSDLSPSVVFNTVSDGAEELIEHRKRYRLPAAGRKKLVAVKVYEMEHLLYLTLYKDGVYKVIDIYSMVFYNVQFISLTLISGYSAVLTSESNASWTRYTNQYLNNLALTLLALLAVFTFYGRGNIESIYLDDVDWDEDSIFAMSVTCANTGKYVLGMHRDDAYCYLRSDEMDGIKSNDCNKGYVKVKAKMFVIRDLKVTIQPSGILHFDDNGIPVEEFEESLVGFEENMLANRALHAPQSHTGALDIHTESEEGKLDLMKHYGTKTRRKIVPEMGSTALNNTILLSTTSELNRSQTCNRQFENSKQHCQSQRNSIT